MAKTLIESYLQRLDSMLVQERVAFSEVEDQIEKVVNKLKEIRDSFDDKESWINEVRDVINDMEYHIDKFLSQKEKHGADQTTLIECFRDDMLKIEVLLSETIQRVTQLDSNMSSHDLKEGQTSASSSSILSSLESDYSKLSECLQDCLMYCCIFPENFLIHKGKLVRLLVAEGLIKEKEGRLMEDIAEEHIAKLVNKGMLEIDYELSGNATKLQVTSIYREFCIPQIEEGKFKSSTSVPHKARCVVTNLDMLKVDNSQLCSLFLIGKQTPLEERNEWLKLEVAKFLRVLDLEGTKIKSLPDVVSDLIHLRYLCLKDTEITELPEGLINLKDLQTLDIRWCGYIAEIPKFVLSLSNLRHLKMMKNYGVCGVKLPQGIGSLTKLLTLTGIDPSGEIAREIGNLTELRRLGVMDVTEEVINELSSSIMKMQGLLSLSLESKKSRLTEKLVLVESFSPPLSLQKLKLEGHLEKIPSWLGSLERLTNIRLGYSHLLENPALVLQFLPNLKVLTLWHAYDGLQMGKEFCKAGGFPKLENLTMASEFLEEWTELEEGALPSLKYLLFHSCRRLRTLPEGLQFVTTLQRLQLMPLLDDHEVRLKPDGGQENYKIKHIPIVTYMTTSMIQELFKERMMNQHH
ncbi:putative disease resistance protein At1g59780 [Cannabis sativa]|uniref:putative disease resistance protein At1g59780 n=1 Tax=Cannabis sativa TaxID=3483 RepID=UPI0029CA1220|nr:putative disease resistance protein At1g59780 [Cannabis sativa]